MGTWSIEVTMTLGGGASWAAAGDAKTSAAANDSSATTATHGTPLP